ncbi:MAG: ATP-binding protein [Spirochaetales bacterium]|uniref:ATP-binding protein n=1 Tax=Candidatus Thalassospirochaeta sargassi TaxID=3119039 RepID=A0AAJ1MP24_9SPIO|nr:ATP-binding protein [Spirochaetales bacterium]
MKEIVVISGKGGTGKTSLTSSFAYIGGKSLVVGDCDVDADDMHLLLKPDYAEKKEFKSGFYAEIDQEKCIACGKCRDICRFKAIDLKDKVYSINDLNCEGCGYCARVCPEGAIAMIDASVGHVFKSQIKNGATMIHARLKPGADNSGKLVAKVKQDAKAAAEKEGVEIILIDGSPGIGCPVVSSLTGADYVILVTEPTPSGIHDLKRVYELVKKFKIKAGLVVNKWDLNKSLTDELETYAKSEGINLISKLPYNEDFTKAITAGKTAAEFYESEISGLIKEAWENARKEIIKE